MSESVFNEPLVVPDEKMLISELGPVYSIYKTIKSEIGRFKDEIQPTWKFYGKKNGWLLKLMSGKKKCYLSSLKINVLGFLLLLAKVFSKK